MVCDLMCLQEQIPKWQEFTRDWTACSNYDNHSRLHSQHNWGGGGDIWPFNKHEIHHFHNEEDMHISSETYVESGYDLNLIS